MKGGLLWGLACIGILAGCVSSEPVEPAAVNESVGLPPPAGDTTATFVNATTNEPRVEVALRAVSKGFYPVNPAFELDAKSVPTGAIVTVTYRNDDLNPLGKHDWTLEGVDGAKTKQAGVGEEAVARFVAPAPGEYAYFCSVPGHRERGMEGKLTVA